MDGSVAAPRPFLALGTRLLAALVLATMAALVKLGSERDAHLTEMIFWRQAITLPLIVMMLLAMRRLGEVRTQRFSAHALRAVFGLTGMFFVYGAVTLLPLAEAATLSFTTPIFAVLLAMILFREKIGIYRWSAVVLGFAGVAIAMQPGGGTVNPFGIAVGMIAAMLVALISFQVQDLNKTESPWSIVFWFTGLSIPVLALALPFVARAHDPVTWLVIGGVGVSGAIGQVLLTTSLRFGSAATIIIMDYTALLWATLFGFYLFDSLPSATLLIGAPLIIAAGILVAWREHRLRQVGKLRQGT